MDMRIMFNRQNIIIRNIILLMVPFMCVFCLFFASCDTDDDDDDNNDSDMTGTLRILSTPQGAAVWFNNQDTGLTTNVELRGISPGIHHVRLNMEGYADWETDIEVKAGEITTIDAVLVPLLYPELTMVTKRYYSPDTPFTLWVRSDTTIRVPDEGIVADVRYYFAFSTTWVDWLVIQLTHNERADGSWADDTPLEFWHTTSAFNGMPVEGDWMFYINIYDDDIPIYVNTCWLEITFITDNS